MFPITAPSANPVFYRTYSRRTADGRESWDAVVNRTVDGISELGKLTNEESALIERMQSELKVLPSGRWLWVGGTDWILKPSNFSGAYNCTSTNLIDWHAFGLMMDLAMMGSGTGAVIEQQHIDKLPVIANRLNVNISRAIGQVPLGRRHVITTVYSHQRRDGSYLVSIQVGDSRRGWVDAYEALLHLASDKSMEGDIQVCVDLGHVRPAGERLHGFGGVSNPIKLPEMFPRMAAVLNGAQGRRLTSIECCLLIDEAALVVVAGNVRRSAGMRQFSCGDKEAAAAKENLWKQDDSGNWVIDPERDALRMANHTRVYHTRPSYEELLEAVTKQFYSGEGAIQFAPEAIARGNVDVLSNEKARKWFIGLYCSEGADAAAGYLKMRKPGMSEQETQHRMQRYGLNPCFALGTMVMTRKGHFPIESLIGKEVEVHDGFKWVKISNFRVTGQNQKVYNVELHNGQVITATAYHKFILEDGARVELKDLQPGMRLIPATTSIKGTIDAKAAYLKGFLIGDGAADSNTGVPSCKLYEPKRVCLDRLVASQKEMPMRVTVVANGRTVGDDYGLTNSGWLKNLNHEDSEWMLPWCSVYKHEFPRQVLNWTPRCQQEFIAGLFDADGTAMDTTNGHGYQITSVSRSFLQGLGLLLTGLGIRWKIGPIRNGGKKDWGERGGICNAQVTYRLTVLQASSIRLARMVVFERLKSFAERTSTYNTKDNSFKVASVTYSHTADEVFCCTVPDTHSFTLTAGVITAQCGEIIGADFYCNLAEVHLNQIDPLNGTDQADAFRSAGLAVASLLHHRFDVKRYRISRELDPIVGVSFTGLFDFFVKAFGVSWLEWWAAGRPDTDEGQEFKIREAAFLSHWKKIVDDTVARYCDAHNLKTPNRCTTVQPAGCLDKDALRIFDQGLLCADEIVAPGSGETDSLPLSVRGGIGATTAIANKPMDLMNITFANKRTLRLTPDHRLSVNGAWIRADKLKPGMQVDYSLGKYSRNTDSQLIPISSENYTRETRALQVGHARGVLTRSITTPTSLTPDLAYLLGALFGNGCLSESKHRIRFVHDDEEIFNRFLQLGEKLFGISATQYKGNGKVRELTFASKQLYDWLHLNGIAKLEPSCNLQRIPERVRRSSRQSILAFIAGLIDTDGCPRNGSLSIDLAPEAFIRHLQQVGEAVGICFGVSHNTMGENLQKVKSIWSARLSCTRSNPDAMQMLNELSTKLKRRPLQEPKADRGYTPYTITEIVHETGRPDYSYDFAVEGVDDDDSWYWQGALKSHNTKSLLTGASPGWHPPKAQRFIRRITFRKNDPVALACLDYGYSIVPSQSDKDENGRLLDDPFDPRCTEWLVEIPTEVSWADLPGADAVDISGFSALAQFDFYMQVQRHYAAHNTSATIEYRENEIEPLARRIHQAINEDEGYISAALLARFDANATFPRLPFEPIDRATYQRLQSDVDARRGSQDFFDALRRYDGGEMTEAGPAGCDSDKCLLTDTWPAGTAQNT